MAARNLVSGARNEISACLGVSSRQAVIAVLLLTAVARPARDATGADLGNTAVVGGLENDTYIGAAWVFTRGAANDGDRERRPCLGCATAA